MVCITHVHCVHYSQSYLVNVDSNSNSVTAMNVSTGIDLLLFPPFGLVVIVEMTRFKTIQTSLLTFKGILIFVLLTFLLFSISLAIGLFCTSVDMFSSQAVRTSLVLLSLRLYLGVSKDYEYRVRDWVVHWQWIMEYIIERRMN